MRVKATLSGRNVCELLARDSEVVIAPRVRKHENVKNKHDMLKHNEHSKHVTERNILNLKVLPYREENFPGPSVRCSYKLNSTSFLNPKTLELLQYGSNVTKHNCVANTGGEKYDNREAAIDSSTHSQMGSIMHSYRSKCNKNDKLTQHREQQNLRGLEEEVVIFIADESVPENCVFIPWHIRVKCRLEIFSKVRVTSRPLIPVKRASKNVSIFLRPMVFAFRQKISLLKIMRNKLVEKISSRTQIHPS